MNTPNKLTVLRIILTFVFMSFLFMSGFIFKVLALLVFVIAALTDYYDGKIARERNLVTNLGKFLDPVADKLLVLGAFLSFVQMHIVPAWMVVIIVTREFAITGFRIFAVSFASKVIPAVKGGKHKTVSQMSAIIIVLIFLILKDLGMKLGFWTGTIEYAFNIFIYSLMFLTCILTVISGAVYIIRNKEVFL